VSVPVSGEHSAGILLYRRQDDGGLSVLLGHMGGPFWAHKMSAAWSIPKGLIEPGEDPYAAALREFEEEIGRAAPDVEYVSLGEFRYTSGKVVTVFAGESDIELLDLQGATVTVEWPRGSSRMMTFPELDTVEWCGIEAAGTRLVRGQVPALAALESLVVADQT
jgi:predicted NUDIX family NTP pyrophosphohydrolase